MPRLTKLNARETLVKLCNQFQKVTGESIGITYSWSGSLNILGPDQFRDIIEHNQAEVWSSLTFRSNNTPVTDPLGNKDMFELLHDSANCNLNQLRKLISWAIQKSLGELIIQFIYDTTTIHYKIYLWYNFDLFNDPSLNCGVLISFPTTKTIHTSNYFNLFVGRSKNIWGNDLYKPSWWPDDIPYVCISKKTSENNITKAKLLAIIDAYKESLNSDKTNNDIVTSTPQKRNASMLNNPTIKREKLDSNISVSSDGSFFNGLLDSPPEKSQITQSELAPISRPPTYNDIPSLIQPSVKERIFKELNSDVMLSDEAINYFCKILKRSYPNVNGLQDTLLCQNMKFKNMTAIQKSIQIHYTGQKHWVCSQFDNNKLFLYDSLYNRKTTMSLDTQMAKLYGTSSMQLEVIVPKIQVQQGPIDCGLFALASATCLAAGINPATQSWDQKAMRAHCIDCFTKEQVSPFPVTSVRGIRTHLLPKPHIFTIDLVCDCNLPEYAYCNSQLNYSSHRTVQCNRCQLWFHNECYGLLNESITEEFACISCINSLSN